MKTDLMKVAAGVALKTVVPALLGGLGALAAVAWNEGFRAFCGL